MNRDDGARMALAAMAGLALVSKLQARGSRSAELTPQPAGGRLRLPPAFRVLYEREWVEEEGEDGGVDRGYEEGFITEDGPTVFPVLHGPNAKERQEKFLQANQGLIRIGLAEDITDEEVMEFWGLPDILPAPNALKIVWEIVFRVEAIYPSTDGETVYEGITPLGIEPFRFREHWYDERENYDTYTVNLDDIKLRTILGNTRHYRWPESVKRLIWFGLQKRLGSWANTSKKAFREAMKQTLDQVILEDTGMTRSELERSGQARQLE
jgi:hypothetical protein